MKYIGAFITIIVLASCSYNKTELPEPEAETIPVVPVTYTSHIKSIIDSNHCLECHIPGGAASFRDYKTYSGIKVVAVSGELKNRAIDNNAVPMPQGYPPLAQDIKDTLQMWLDQGALE